jgi:hypothetical protein
MSRSQSRPCAVHAQNVYHMVICMHMLHVHVHGLLHVWHTFEICTSCAGLHRQHKHLCISTFTAYMHVYMTQHTYISTHTTYKHVCARAFIQHAHVDSLTVNQRFPQIPKGHVCGALISIKPPHFCLCKHEDATIR